MENDFGMVPYPKYSEDQTKYLSGTVDGYINVVPSTAPDLERTSIILEALAVETKNIVMSAYINKSLESKALRTEKSITFLNIILDNRTLDLGATVWMSTTRFALVDNCFAKGSSDFVSSVAKNQNSIDKTINDAVSNFLAEG